MRLNCTRVTISALFTLFGLLICAKGQEQSGNRKAKKPLLVTYRRHDRNFLQALRIYQQDLPYEEWPLERRLKYNFTNDAGENKELEVAYYVNDELEADDTTYNHLVVGSIHQAYVSRLYRSYMYTYDREEDRKKSSDKRLVSKERCARDLRYLVDNLPGKKKSINPELAAFYDSFARAEDGLLYGNFYWSGVPNQCDKRLIIEPNQENLSNSIVFKGRYCIASIKSPKWTKIVRQQRYKLLKANNYFKYEGQDYDYERYFRIQVGMCMPESCDSLTIDWAYNQVEELLMHRLEKYRTEYKLSDLYCLPDETSELRKLEPEGWLFIWCAGLWLTAIALATFYDVRSRADRRLDKETHQRRSHMEKFVEAMSFTRNWKRLWAVEELPETGQEPASSDLLFMNFFKVWCTPIIIWSHFGMMTLELAKYSNIRISYSHRFIFHSFNVGVFMTDTFFTMTGFITCYLMLHHKFAERNKPLAWLYTIFHRYWRLAPLYLIAFWFTKHIFMFTSNGPNWDYATNNMTLRSICRSESWWYPLTLTVNFRPLHDECIMGAWYIGNDMQFYLVTPFIMIGLSKWPRATWLACLSSLGLSSLLSFHTIYTNPRVSHLDLLRPLDDICRYNNWDVHQAYLQPQYRIGPYLVGILAAHYAYTVLSGQRKSILYNHPKFNKGKQHNERLRKILLNLVFFVGLFIYLSATTATWQLENLTLPQSGSLVRLIASMVYSSHHTYAGFGLSLFFIGLMFGQSKNLRRFMSKPIWVVLSRLNYVIILVQVEVIRFLYEGSNNTMNLSYHDFFTGCIAVCFFSYLISIILTPLLEQPMNQLEHQFVYSVIVPRKPASGSKNEEHTKKWN